MAGIATWYNSQYSTWNRTRRLQAQPYLARVDTNTARVATEMAQQQQQQQQAVVVNMGDLSLSDSASKNKSDTLFGPNIGIVGGCPDWTQRHEKVPDELTPEIVKGWIAKSKETNPSTTTLQALVNLKRPTLRLAPLEVAASDDPDHIDSQHHYGLEFEYDCDAPKCAISVHVLLSPHHRLAGKPDASGLSKVLVYESVVEGGFGKILKLEEGAMLELGRFEHRPDVPAPPSKESSGVATPVADTEGQSTPVDGTASGAADAANNRHQRKRFTTFHFRKRTVDRSVVGPALAVVDAEVIPTVPADEDKPKEEDKDDATEGVRVTIRLSALDEEGHDLAVANEQTTYLHVVRYGATLVAVDGETEEDNRPWVVKVVKREATIGPHTFHLHEIYGLSANSNTPSQPTHHPIAPQPDGHVYPPVAPPAAPTHDDEPSSECLLCLSSPREVVLLPCRHLVACRECAINMIEFGAGGTIVHTDSDQNAGNAAEAGAAGEGAAGEGAAGEATGEAQTPAQPTPTIPPPTRRKRKAKGWFCPVCRQPYTSLLRITTMPPSKDGKDEGRDSTSVEDHVPPVSPVTPTTPSSPTARTGLAAGIRRALGRTAAPQPDLERGQAASPVAAA
ncbi:hypothetical protein CERSUDRAFT_85481 [Gelatoporia subvermispora B]|uniref:RING-type domain-containing protein n=1 Tax=Ceriporiopsis subvermispora (strain B) TaxID=914234 RepID=M2PHI8_CERS8|nr:hypothetical protein CERSUDRAFT_85481 [Gelatoporia subvermispora B]